MPKCDICGFAHAQAGHCINCDSPDPLRRLRLLKAAAVVAAFVLGLALLVSVALRYAKLESTSWRTDREARAKSGIFAPGVPAR